MRTSCISMSHVQKLDHVYFVHPSTDISIDILVDISTDRRPMHRSICQPTYRSSVG